MKGYNSESSLNVQQQEAHEAAPKGTVLSTTGPPAHKLSHLWSAPVLNPLNLKCYTLPILNLSTPYGRNFHLAWLGFFVAFLSWFAFPPLIPEAIKADLKLTAAQVANSNIVALTATLVIRLVVGPAVDRFGPRLVMCTILVAGAIPSGLAGTIHNATGLYVIRFFIGILGGTFVPCQAWTSAFFDKNTVGTANALVGGWGNAGGGATYAVMTSLYAKLRKTMTLHKAWRVAFAVVPVPILIFVAIITFFFGTDHPAGKWAQRHMTPATAAAVMTGHEVQLDTTEQHVMQNKKADGSWEAPTEKVREVSPEDEEDYAGQHGHNGTTISGDLAQIDVAVNEPLTFKTAMKILSSPLTWLPALAYMTSFGFELAVDSVLGAQILTAHKPLGQLNAGYLASIFGLLNIFTRPFGGWLADKLYARYGVKSKKYLTIACNLAFGALAVGFGKLYASSATPSLGGLMALIVLMAVFNEMSNGSNFALVPHCNSFNNGVMTGLVGAMGNLGGIFFNLMFRFQTKRGVAWQYAGAFTLIVNAALIFFPTPKR